MQFLRKKQKHNKKKVRKKEYVINIYSFYPLKKKTEKKTKQYSFSLFFNFFCHFIYSHMIFIAVICISAT